jgi:CRISPR system Cascade subunit CasC
LASQCIKRAWRISDEVGEVLESLGEGVRSREQWYQLGVELVAKGVPIGDAVSHVMAVRTAFEGDTKKNSEPAAEPEVHEATPATPAEPVAGSGKGKGKPKPVGLDTLKADLFYFNAAEIELARTLLSESLDPSGPTSGKPWSAKDVLIRQATLPMSGDVALFGRMVAGNKALNIEGALQVAHPFTVNKSVVDDDFFTAVDDLAPNGAAHLSSNAFGSGLYYGYVLVDIALLLKNLGNDKAKARALLTALVNAIATVAPSGKQNSFASRSYATFMLAETGDAQPRSFADAYLTPVKSEPLADAAIVALKHAKSGIERAFPSQRTQSAVLDRSTDTGTIEDIVAQVCSALGE